MKINIIALLILISSNLIGQNLSFENCSVSPMYPTSDTQPNFISEDLKEYFKKKLPKDYFNKASKKITVQILIDKKGTPCCKSILNYKNIDTELLKEIINEMPDWIPAKNRGKEINISTIIQLQTKKGQLKKVTLVGGENKVEENKSQSKGLKSSGEIEEALNNKESLTSFSLYGKELMEIDPRIGELRNLKELYLGKNNFETIPQEIFSLDNLEQLHIYNNNLESIPSDISKLINLKFLMIQDNQIETLPKEIGMMKGLLFIDLSGNPLKEGEVERLKSLLPICQIKK
jgi:Leucine-rich repeat (LRR) protein